MKKKHRIEDLKMLGILLLTSVTIMQGIRLVIIDSMY
jgi:hypothetical protein